MSKIEPLNECSQDLHEINQACEEYINFISSEEYNEDKLDNYENAIFEASMKSVYGDEVFDYVNGKI